MREQDRCKATSLEGTVQCASKLHHPTIEYHSKTWDHQGYLQTTQSVVPVHWND